MTDLESRIIQCRHCPRLRAYRDKNQTSFPEYWNKPVTASGDFSGLLIVGLAPGLHGANKTGVPFTGDASGDLLFKCLNALGLENSVTITNVVKCAPPENLPLASERKNCRKFFIEEIQYMAQMPRVFFCLGRIAHEETLKSLGLKQRAFAFSHGAVHEVQPGVYLVDSYHCSRYNINTRRLTEPMFISALQCAAELARLTHAEL